MNDNEIKQLIASLNDKSESEILELKEAKSKFDLRELGQYFSALSNEANLKGKRSAFLIFGVTDKGDVCGTNYRNDGEIPSKGLMRLKHEITQETNNGMTFRDIFESDIDGKRVVVFEIPAAIRGIPTTWNNAAYAREGESLVPLPLNKIDEIRSQPPEDWSRIVMQEATFDDLDPDAVATACTLFRERYGERESLVESLSDEELLDKAGITYRGRITNAALLLLGTKESARFIVGALPKITWTLYESSDKERTYHHFSPPFILAIDKLLAVIRNEDRPMMRTSDSLLPTSVKEYDVWSLRELIGNAIAHQAYDAGGKINVNEFPDRIVFMNEGAFIPGSLETALTPGYKPPYYRNPFLTDAMLHVGMLDQNALGIRRICEKARERAMPLPTYDLSDPQRVVVSLPNHELSERYADILRRDPDLPLLTVLALDKVQKDLPLSESETSDLLERGLVKRANGGDGFELVVPSRAPEEVLIMMPPREGTPEHADYLESAKKRLRIKSDAKRRLKERIVGILEENGPSSRVDISDRMDAPFFNEGYFLTEDMMGEQVYRLLKQLEQEGIVRSEGETRGKLWMIRREES